MISDLTITVKTDNRPSSHCRMILQWELFISDSDFLYYLRNKKRIPSGLRFLLEWFAILSAVNLPYKYALHRPHRRSRLKLLFRP